MNGTCGERLQLPWDWGAEVCQCTLPPEHVFAPDDLDRHHRCPCSSMWVDDQQIDEARAKRAAT